MPLRWKTSGLLGSRRAHAATNRQSAANRALISRLLGVNWPFIDCEGARQRFTHVAAPFADTFLRGDVTVTYDHVQPRLARRPPRARLRGGAVHQAEGRRGARGGGAGRVRAPAGRLRRLRQRGDELIPDRSVRCGLASWYGAHSTGSLPLAAGRSTAPSSPRPTTICPFDSRVRVCNLNNDRAVELRVTDRVPLEARNNGRLLDVSDAAARPLEMVEDGVVPIEITVLAWGLNRATRRGLRPRPSDRSTGSRRANAATNREAAAHRPLSGRSSVVSWLRRRTPEGPTPATISSQIPRGSGCGRRCGGSRCRKPVGPPAACACCSR